MHFRAVNILKTQLNTKNYIDVNKLRSDHPPNAFEYKVVEVFEHTFMPMSTMRADRSTFILYSD